MRMTQVEISHTLNIIYEVVCMHCFLWTPFTSFQPYWWILISKILQVWYMFSLDLSCLSGSWVVQWIWYGNFYPMASISNQCRFHQFFAENWIIYPCKDPGSNSLYWVEFWICKGYEFEIFTSIVFDEKWSWCLHFINQELRSQNCPAKSVKFV